MTLLFVILAVLATERLGMGGGRGGKGRGVCGVRFRRRLREFANFG